MRLPIAPLAVSAFVLLTGPAVAGDPPPVKGYATADQVEGLKKRVAELEAKLAAKAPCACGAACPCGTAAAPATGPGLHVSPDGTVNVRHADGVYRPVPGAPRQAPQFGAAPAPLPSFSSSCPDGRCPLPR